MKRFVDVTWKRFLRDSIGNLSMFVFQYSCEHSGSGGGGEYSVQTGFGWSNGVVIEYLSKYGDEDFLTSI